MDILAVVREAAAQAAAESDNALRVRDDAIRVARAEGKSLRKIAAAAGMSHEQVRRILARPEPEEAVA